MGAQHVLITGASSGIGRALALRYAQDGARLSLFGRDRARLEAAADACRAKGASAVEIYPCDVQDRAAMAREIARALAAAPVDLLIANAGVATGLGPGREIESPEAMRAALAINVVGVWNTIDPALPAMIARRSGTIVMVGSMAGVRGLPHSPAYCAAKAAVHSYAESMRGALAPHGVDVILVVPGYVKTPMSEATKVKSPLSRAADSWQPGLMEDWQAAQIIHSGIERRRPIIAFPLFVWFALRLCTMLPPRLVDAVMLWVTAEVPETKERVAL